jgi:hypothetical protein
MKSLFYFTLSFLLFSLDVSLASAQSLSALGLPGNYLHQTLTVVEQHIRCHSKSYY